jgi:ABC-type multidrug transport system fused ATPase/permease subunit
MSGSDTTPSTIREITATVLAAIVALVTTWMLVQTFLAAQPNYENMQNVLSLALPVLGVVLGYYFGRVPAEKRAEAAEAERSGAQALVMEAQTSLQNEVATRAAKEQEWRQMNAGIEALIAETERQGKASALPPDFVSRLRDIRHSG